MHKTSECNKNEPRDNPPLDPNGLAGRRARQPWKGPELSA